jgi:hypothetical protein
MPRGDRTGPMGAGAMSGRAAGICAGFDTPGYANPTSAGGVRMRAGRGRGSWSGPAAGSRGWCYRPFAIGRMGRRYFGGYGSALQPLNPELEKESLRNRSRVLQSELDAVNQRLAEIEPEEKAR